MIALISVGAVVVMVALVTVIFDISQGGHSPAPIAAPSNPVPTVNLPPAPGATPIPSGPPTVPLPAFPGTPGAVTGRIEDPDAGISYAQFAPPWQISTPVGPQFFTAGEANLTETSSSGVKWYAIISSLQMSSPMRPAYGGNPANLRTFAALQFRLLASNIYPADRTSTEIADQPLTVAGRQAWLVGYHETFNAPGFKTAGETGVLIMVAGPGPDPGVLYISIPDNRKDLLPDIPAVIKSLQVG